MTPAQTEAAAKLKLYYTDYGPWVYRTTPAKALERSREYFEEARIEDPEKPERRIKLLIKAVQFEAISRCLELLGDLVPTAPEDELATTQIAPTPPTSSKVYSFEHYRTSKQVVALSQSEGVSDTVPAFEFIPEGSNGVPDMSAADLSDLDVPMEQFNMVDLTQRCVKPRFKIGDPAWVADWDGDEPVGFLPVIVTGLELYPDEVVYLIGFFDEETCMVDTNFGGVTDDEIFVDIPDKNTPRRGKPQLSVVKND